MHYYKNAELVKLYNVSDKAIRNWIASAKRGKIGLELHEQNGRWHIVDTLVNSGVMEELAAKGRKYHNKRLHRDCMPSSELLNRLSIDQLWELIADLAVRRALPPALSFAYRPASLQSAAKQIIEANDSYIVDLCTDYQYINIITYGRESDLAASLLNTVKQTGKLKATRTIEPASDALDRFGRYMVQDSFGEDASHTLTLFILTEGMLESCVDPADLLHTAVKRLGPDALVIASTQHTTPFEKLPDASREHFESTLALLGLDADMYSIEQTFSKDGRRLRIIARLAFDVTIHFTVADYQRQISFSKGEEILLQSSRAYSNQEILEYLSRVGLTALHISQRSNGQLSLLVGKTG
jgi:hypothetical protein